MFKKICDIASESIIVTDAESKIIYVNDAFCNLTGYSRKELIGRNPSILKSGIQDASVYEDLWKTITSGKIWHGEFANRKKDGSIYWEYATITAFDEDGLRYYLGVKENITSLKELENNICRLKKIKEKAEALDRYVKSLLGSID